ncbi:MAG: DUF2259 domain-containing protein [Spirochaetales bacterium]|nr:DUF2259 domain-containing protein [Spirochaetales bacterium]
MKRTIAIFIAATLAAMPVFAGDVPTLVNLGFSPDSAYFLFGQYGLDGSSGVPYAELYLVDAKKNDFVKDGVARFVAKSPLEAGQDPAGALFGLYRDRIALVQKYRIDHLAQGRILYLLVDGEDPSDPISFRDFATGDRWTTMLRQVVVEKGDDASSSFSIDVKLTTKAGTEKSFSAGNPTFVRKGVRGYVIRRILIAPDGRTLVFIVEKKLVAKGGDSVRYMVETIRIP